MVRPYYFGFFVLFFILSPCYISFCLAKKGEVGYDPSFEKPYTDPDSDDVEGADPTKDKDINEKTRVLFNLYFEADLLPWMKYRTFNSSTPPDIVRRPPIFRS